MYDRVDKFSLNYLIERGANHSKSKIVIKSMNKSKFRTQPYLLCDKLTRQEAQLLFSLRCRTLELKSNYKSKYKDDLSCRTCSSGDLEDERHLLTCQGLKLEEDYSEEDYLDVFSDLKSQIRITKIFGKILRKREILLDLEENHLIDGPPAPSLVE